VTFSARWIHLVSRDRQRDIKLIDIHGVYRSSAKDFASKRTTDEGEVNKYTFRENYVEITARVLLSRNLNAER